MRPELALVIPLLCQAQVLDRIAVTVGKTVITESEVLTHLKVAAFLDQKEPDFSAASKRKAAEQLVDQLLLRREVPSVTVAPDAKPLANRFATQAEYEAALKRYGIQDRDVQAEIGNALASLEASGRRFRPEIQLTDEEVRTYYDKLVDRWRAEKRAPIPSFDQAQDQVRTLLLNERVSDALEQWLGNARMQSNVVYREKVFQ